MSSSVGFFSGLDPSTLREEILYVVKSACDQKKVNPSKVTNDLQFKTKLLSLSAGCSGCYVDSLVKDIMKRAEVILLNR